VRAAVANLCKPCNEGWLEQLTATLLGRALAHEVGHYLLGPEHSATGLMRAKYLRRDMFAPERTAFSLTAAQIAALRERRTTGR
jgi:hypothetical protein